MIDSSLYKVLLPERISNYKSSGDHNQFMNQVRKYMERYPHYVVNSVEENFIICSRKTEDSHKRTKKR